MSQFNTDPTFHSDFAGASEHPQEETQAVQGFVNPFRPEGDASLTQPVPPPPAPGVKQSPFAAASPQQSAPGGVSAMPSRGVPQARPKTSSALPALSPLKTGTVPLKLPTASIKDSIGVRTATATQALPRSTDLQNQQAASPFQTSPLRQQMGGPKQGVARQATPKLSGPAAKLQKRNREPKQLAIKAIFGITRDLNQAEILKFGSALPGITTLAMAPPMAANAFEDFCASIEKMGFGDSAAMELSSATGTVDIVSLDGVSIIVKKEGEYRPGVRETLMLLAREISRL